MKYRICALVLLLATVVCGCKTCTGFGSFTVTRDTAEVVVEGTSNPINDVLDVNVIPALDLDFDLQNELEKNDAEGAKAVYLNALSLRTTESSKDGADDVDNFDFLSRVEFYVESADPDTELEKQLVASIDPVPEGQTELDLDTNDSVDLKPYAKEGMVLTTAGAGSVPEDDVSIIGTVTLEIETL